MTSLLWSRAFYAALAHAGTVALSLVVAFLLRFEFDVPEDEVAVLRQAIFPLLAIRLFFFHRERLFQGWWQYVAIQDVTRILRATTAGSLAFVVLVLIPGLAPGFPRSVIVLEWLLTLQLVTGSRVVVRIGTGFLRRLRIATRRKVLIVGGGAVAASIARELSLHPSGKAPVGYLEDDPGAARGQILRELPRLGTRAELRDVVDAHGIEEVWIALPSAMEEEIRTAIRDCRQRNVPFRTIPSIRQAVDEPTRPTTVDLDELFDPPRTTTASARTREVLLGKTVLLFGGAGRLGVALARAITEGAPSRIVLYDRSESGLYYAELDLARHAEDVPVTAVIGDVLDEDRLDTVFAAYAPDFVIHAAAYTSTRFANEDWSEIRENNLRGLWNVLSRCRRDRVARTLVLSGDEARGDRLACLHLAGEALVARTAGAGGGSVVAVRFPTTLADRESPVTRIAEDLRRGSPARVSAHLERVRLVSLANVVPVLLEALATGDDGDILTAEVGQEEAMAEVLRTLRHVWNAESIGLEADPAGPIHEHPSLPGRRITGSNFVVRPPVEFPCAAEILAEEGLEGRSSARTVAP